MKFSARIITPPIKLILSMLCRIDAGQLDKVPEEGPLIIIINHVNFLEVPLVFSFLLPRPVIGIVKKETWKNPILAILARSWDAIAIVRNSSDSSAMEKALSVLANKGIIILAPEGTRSGNGQLQKGHGGVVQLALKGNAPILPIAHYGGEQFWRNFKRLKRTPFSMQVGEAFYLTLPDGSKAPASISKSMRNAMTEAVMNRLSLLLPPAQRGAYPDPENAPQDLISLIN
ncbi:lysophospholipid acyltransferase family protein [Spirochaetota bacterium]